MMTDYFFVGGAPKSGTTWLQRSLDLHPEIVCSGEGHLHEFIVRPVAEMLRTYNEKLAVVGQAVYEGEPYYAEVTRGEQIEIMRTVMSMLMVRRTKPGARLVGDKTPANAKFISDLAVLFPTMKFVAMLRDPRDVAASRLGHAVRVGFLKSGERGSDAYREVVTAAALDWRTMAERVSDFAQRKPAQVAVVKYEALLDGPSGELRRVFDFLGVDTTPAQLAEIVNGSRFEAFSGGRRRGVERQDSFYRKGVKGDWTNLLTEEALDIVTRHCADASRRAGYKIASDQPARGEA